ncbi:hypothetical protein F2Q68_00035198, partial [Brassica cretica]
TSLSFVNISSVEGILPFSPKHVVITKLVSQFGLLVHCTNKGIDLGVRSVLIDQSFDFRFRVNLRKTTNYSCLFSWPGIVRTFDIFRADRDDSKTSKFGICSECIWYISEPGPCRISTRWRLSFLFFMGFLIISKNISPIYVYFISKGKHVSFIYIRFPLFSY